MTTTPACLYAAGSTAADGSFRHPRFTGDGYLSPCRSSDARHPEHDARYDQLTLSLYMVMLGVGQVIFGPLSDRIGRRPILLAGATAFVIASLGAAWSSTAPAFVAFRLLQAVGASAMLVATFATVRDVYANRPEGVVIYGLFSSMLALRSALSPEH